MPLKKGLLVFDKRFGATVGWKMSKMMSPAQLSKGTKKKIEEQASIKAQERVAERIQTCIHVLLLLLPTLLLVSIKYWKIRRGCLA